MFRIRIRIYQANAKSTKGDTEGHGEKQMASPCLLVWQCDPDLARAGRYGCARRVTTGRMTALGSPIRLMKPETYRSVAGTWSTKPM